MEQLFKSREGHFPRLAVLVRNLWFQRHIARVIVDEAHNIHTAGLSHYGLDAFRPAWGRLDELKAILPHRVHWVFLSATFPPHIRTTVEKKLLQPGYTAIHVTSNRPNTVYAAHEVLNSIEDFQNYECFLACPFSLVSQPRVLIFVDKKELACQIAAHLDSCLPSEHQDKGIVRHYHSQMSQKYLQVAHEAFTTPEGNCRIMVATSGQSVVSIWILSTVGRWSSLIYIRVSTSQTSRSCVQLVSLQVWSMSYSVVVALFVIRAKMPYLSFSTNPGSMKSPWKSTMKATCVILTAPEAS